MSGSGAAPRLARVYEGRDAKGRPFAERAAVPPEVVESVLRYLESAPVVLAARSFDTDEFSPGDRDVPLNFRTDGVWIWAGAVPHYLRKHALPPEPELLRHILDREFRVGAVGESTLDLAVRVVTGA